MLLRSSRRRSRTTITSSSSPRSATSAPRPCGPSPTRKRKRSFPSSPKHHALDGARVSRELAGPTTGRQRPRGTDHRRVACLCRLGRAPVTALASADSRREVVSGLLRLPVQPRSNQFAASGPSPLVVHASPEYPKVVHPRGSQRGSQALIDPRPSANEWPGICQVGTDRASVVRCRRSLLVAVGRCCCGHPRDATGPGYLPRPAVVLVRRPFPHRTDCWRSIRRREGVKGGFACMLTRQFHLCSLPGSRSRP